MAQFKNINVNGLGICTIDSHNDNKYTVISEQFSEVITKQELIGLRDALTVLIEEPENFRKIFPDVRYSENYYRK